MRAIGILLVSALGSVGCDEDLAPIRYETDKALIGTDFDLPQCEGDFDRLDAQIRFVKDFLDAASDEKSRSTSTKISRPTAQGWDAETPSWAWSRPFGTRSITRSCTPSSPASPRPGLLVGRDRTGAGRNGTHEGDATVLDSAEITDERQFDYATAGHFVRWLLEAREPTAYRSDTAPCLPAHARRSMRYPIAVPAAPSTPSSVAPLEVDDDDRALLVAVAEGLADDLAGRIQDTKTLKESLEQELGPIALP